MSDDFVTQLRLQLREAALQEERRTPVARRLFRARKLVPGPLPLAAAIAVALLAVAVAIGTLSLRDEPEPTAPRVLDTLHVSDGLTSIASGFGSAWATDLGPGRVLRIDPGTGRVVARVAAGSEVHVGTGAGSPDVVVAAGAGAVWALTGDLQNGGREGPVVLLRIDPRTNRIVARIPMRAPSGGTFSPLAVQAEGDRVWVLGDAGALRIDPATDAPDAFVPIREPAQGVVAGGDQVWILTTGGRLLEIDARTGRTVQTVRVPISTTTRLAWSRPGLLALTDVNRLTTIEQANGKVLWRATLPGAVPAFAPDGEDALWVFVSRAPERRDLLVRLDAGSGRRLGQVELREPGSAGVAEVGREAWVASPDGRISIVR